MQTLAGAAGEEQNARPLRETSVCHQLRPATYSQGCQTLGLKLTLRLEAFFLASRGVGLVTATSFLTCFVTVLDILRTHVEPPKLTQPINEKQALCPERLTIRAAQH